MHQQTGTLFYRYRFVSAGIFTVAFLIVISLLVTAMGANTVLASGAEPSNDAADMAMTENPNVIVAGASRLVNSTHRASFVAGTTLYSGCQSITGLTARSGAAMMFATTSAFHGLASTTVFAVRGIGSVVLLPVHVMDKGLSASLRTPGRLLGAVASGPTVGSIFRPSADQATPVISNETSAAVLVRFSAKQQQEIASLQAAQLAANHNLGGLAVAGDPTHGGYPAAWDAPQPQDSRLDSWGMYNRECVSYAAWKVYQTYGHMPYWGGVGNASQWLGDARAAGIATGLVPQVHSVAISMRGYYGHAMWVEAVSGDMIYVSQYNYDLRGHYSEMWVKSSAFSYIYFR